MWPNTVGAQASARIPRQHHNLATPTDAVSNSCLPCYCLWKFYPRVQTLMGFFKLLMLSGLLGAPGEAVAKRAAEG